MRIKFGWMSWLCRVLALCVLATFPFWWIALWCDERRFGQGFWETAWLLLSEVVTCVVTGEN